MKSVFITGAGRGLGKGFAVYFLKSNYTVFAGVRLLQDDKHIVPNLHYVKIDVADDNSIISAYEEISHMVKSLDFLINNAGVNKDSATNNHKEMVCNIKYLDRKSLLTMFNVNAVAPLIVTKIFLPLLTANPSFVINISSGRASLNDEYPNPSANYGYRSSKSALNMLTYCSVADLPKNIKTFTVHPGGVRTDMNPTGPDDPQEQAEKIINITSHWKDDFNGMFLRYNGVLYP